MVLTNQDLEINYVLSDHLDEASLKYAQILDMLNVTFEKSANKPKTGFQICAKSKSMKLSSRRHLGVPALVILDGKSRKQAAFLSAKAHCVASMKA